MIRKTTEIKGKIEEREEVEKKKKGEKIREKSYI